jgi:hypothetical protein
MIFDNLVGAVAKFTVLWHGAKVIEKAALEAGGKEFLKRARAAIGTYEYGWQPLAESTVAHKSRGDTPLLETGEMRDSGSYQIVGNHIVIGFSDPKIRFHEYGTKHIPPRPVIGGTIDHHGKEIAHLMAVYFGEVLVGTLASGNVLTSITHMNSRRR